MLWPVALHLTLECMLQAVKMMAAMTMNERQDAMLNLKAIVASLQSVPAHFLPKQMVVVLSNAAGIKHWADMLVSNFEAAAALLLMLQTCAALSYKTDVLYSLVQTSGRQNCM